MELLIVTMCFGAFTYWGLCIARYFDARAESREKLYRYDTKRD